MSICNWKGDDLQQPGARLLRRRQCAAPPQHLGERAPTCCFGYVVQLQPASSGPGVSFLPHKGRPSHGRSPSSVSLVAEMGSGADELAAVVAVARPVVAARSGAAQSDLKAELGRPMRFCSGSKASKRDEAPCCRTSKRTSGKGNVRGGAGRPTGQRLRGHGFKSAQMAW